MSRRLAYGLAALFLVLSAPSFASAQTVPQIGRAVLWNKVAPKLASLTASNINAMFSSGPGPQVSGYRWYTSIDYNGEVISISVGGENMVYALSFAAANDFGGDVAFRCFTLSECMGAFSSSDRPETTATNDYNWTLADSFGSAYGVFATQATSTTPVRYRALITSHGGEPRGAQNIFNNPAFGSTCSGGWVGTTDYFDSIAAAVSSLVARFHAVGSQWAQKAVACVDYLTYLGVTGSEVPAYQFAIADAKRRNLSTTRFFRAEGLEVVDDTPENPNDSDGDGIPDADDPNPYNQPDTDGDGVPDRYDPTPNGEAPVDPDDPTRDVDYESNCNVINLFCWARWAFTPQVDWPTEWGELRAAFLDRAPFGYVGWLGDITAGAGGAQALPTFDMAGVSMSVGNSSTINWWLSTGRYWLVGVFGVGALIGVAKMVTH